MNRVIICGLLTKDPEVFTTNNGVAITKFTVAVRRKFRNDNGEFDADYFNCSAFNKLGTEVVMKYTKKASRVLVSGRLESSHKDEDGKKITYWNLLVDDIELASAKPEGEPVTKNETKVEEDDGLPF